MGQGRGSAIVVAMNAFLGLMLLHSQVVNATTFIVGDARGWTMGVSSWPNGKTFMAGDILVFNYDYKAHNVILVDQANYDACTLPQGATIYNTDNDPITLEQGSNLFICGIPVHCKVGMKIAITAQ